MDAIDMWRHVRAALSASPRPTHAEIAAGLGVDRSRVANLARLAELPSEVQDLIEAGELSTKHGETLLTRGPKPGRARLKTAALVSLAQSFAGKGDGKSVEALRLKVAQAHGRRPLDDDSDHPDPDIRELEGRLSGIVGARVKFDHRKDGSGWMQIQYTSSATLDGVLARLGLNE